MSSVINSGKTSCQFAGTLSANREHICLVFVSLSLDLPQYYIYSTLLAVTTYY